VGESQKWRDFLALSKGRAVWKKVLSALQGPKWLNCGGVPLERFWTITISTTGLHDRCFASFAFCAGLSIHQSNGSKHKTGAKLQLATIRVTVTVFSATPLPLMKISWYWRSSSWTCLCGTDPNWLTISCLCFGMLCIHYGLAWPFEMNLFFFFCAAFVNRQVCPLIAQDWGEDFAHLNCSCRDAGVWLSASLRTH